LERESLAGGRKYCDRGRCERQPNSRRADSLAAQDERAALERKRAEEQVAAARAKHLNSLVGKEVDLWHKIHRLIATTRPNNYAEAIRILTDLRDLASASSADFEQAIRDLFGRHAAKPALKKRLIAAGFQL
jgi:hypothetical protein